MAEQDAVLKGRPAPAWREELLERPALELSVQCTYCHGPLARREAAFCAACLAPHHADCHAAHGECSAPGCGERATVRPRGHVRAPRRRARRAGASERASTQAPADRSGRLATLLASAALAGVAVLGGALLWTPPEAALEALPQPRPPAPAEAAARRVIPFAESAPDVPAAELSLVARGLGIDARLELGGRLVLSPQAEGYTYVYRVPAVPYGQGTKVVMVLEPGETVTLHGATFRETIHPSPDDVVVVEVVGRDKVRLARLRTTPEGLTDLLTPGLVDLRWSGRLLGAHETPAPERPPPEGRSGFGGP